jgi:Tfp pilus assembly protein PilX
MDPDNYINVSTATISYVASTPEYFIERLPKVPLSNSSLVVGFQGASKDVQYYRITGKGTGSGGRAEVILQSTYHR